MATCQPTVRYTRASTKKRICEQIKKKLDESKLKNEKKNIIKNDSFD